MSIVSGPVRPMNATRPAVRTAASADRLTPPGLAAGAAASVPYVQVTEIPGDHFDAYEAQFAASCGAALGWFRPLLTPETERTAPVASLPRAYP